VVASSHSGNTEETVTSLIEAIEGGCCCLVISTGGRLAEIAGSAEIPFWQFVHRVSRVLRLAIRSPMLSLMLRVRNDPNPHEELVNAVEIMRRQQDKIRAESAVVDNPAKRMAGQMVDRWVSVLVSGYLAPVARHGKPR